MQKVPGSISEYYNILSWVTFFLLLMPPFVMAQSNLTVDEQYKQAREAAFKDSDYDKARRIAYRALERSPDYHGIRIFISRLFAWEENYTKARDELNVVLAKEPQNRRALLAIVDVESWSGNYEEAVAWTQKALKYHPDDKKFLLARAAAFEKMENYGQAEKNYLAILHNHASSKARNRLRAVRFKQMKYNVGLSYRYDSFRDIFDPWKFWEIQLGRQTKIGSVIARIQYANRFSTDGLQFNLDAYPSLLEGLYAYINVGGSESSIYPRYRFGLSLYKSLPSSFEAAGGVRYLNFSASNTIIYTLSLSKYLGNYLLTARSYIIPSFAGSSQSFNLLLRRYFNDDRTYLGFTGGFGSASADIQFAEDIKRQDSWSLGISGQYPINKRLNIGGNAGFDSEEFANFDRQRFSFKAFLSYRF